MTSNPPAEPRPPPLKRPPEPLSLPHSRSVSGSSNLSGTRTPVEQKHFIHLDHDQNAEARPAKRRKVEPEATIAQVTAANATAVSANASVPSQGSHLRLLPVSNLKVQVKRFDHDDGSDDSDVDDLPDLPNRPWNNTPNRKATEDQKPSHRSRVHVPVPTTPDAMKEPASVPRLVLQRPAGFFPWTGKQPEDVMNDVTVKQGFFDKAPTPTEKELNTARVPLYNAFKHKGGVENLSILFSLVLDQKNQHGLISSVSTFRPPPRVTLTEAKRKAWINDLADADVPLRKLSRTIPQGIRGQILLDLCLQSSVPLSRAIWFAKCVCANEIRTLKRKGTSPAVAIGTETKWLREWTINVEQFLEQQLGQGHLPEFRSNIQYALRLTTRLYLENLLDRDHYLDWIVRSFNAAEVKHIPFWLMMVHTCKRDISLYRRRARNFAEALINQYGKLSKTSSAATATVRAKVGHVLHGLLLDRPRDFLMPERWPELANIIESCLNMDSVRERQLFERLNFINKRTMGYNRQAFSAQRAPGQAVIEILDNARAPYDVTALCKSLDSVCPKRDQLVLTCLEWATTRFRTSSARVYLFTRLAKRWQQAGHIVDTLILDYLSLCREQKTTVKTDVLKHLVAQLSRAGCFPIAKYSQWLMVRGLPKVGSVSLPTAVLNELNITTGSYAVTPDPLQLLLDLSLQKTEHHVINLRNSVLKRAGFDPEIEQTIVQRCTSYLRHELQLLATFGSVERDEKSESAPPFSHLPWTIRSELSTWLRQYVVDAVQSSAPSADVDAPLTSLRMINCEQFCFIRYILEQMEDDAVLADVVGILTSTRDEDLLASLVSTIQFHAEAFSAMGALQILQARICQIYMSWRPLKSNMPLLTNTLLDLCTSFPVKNPSIRLLQQDLVRGDRGRAVAACSPYSDGIAESLQQAGATFIEDFEAILQSEPNMTEQTMSGLFSVLIDRIEKQQKQPDDLQTLLAFCQLLSRLRLCRKIQGELLIKKWISRMLLTVETNFATSLLQNLIATGCVGLSVLPETLALAKTSFGKCLPVRNILRECLNPTRQSLTNPIRYQVQEKWWEWMRREPRQVLGVLGEARMLTEMGYAEGYLLELLVSNKSTGSASLSVQATKWILENLDRLLLFSPQSNVSELRGLFSSINIFSHEFVQVRFSLGSPAGSGAGQDVESTVKGLSETLDQICHANDGGGAGNSTFGQLLRAVGPEIAGQLRHKVENEFLETLAKVPTGKATSPLSAVFPSDTRHLESVMQQAFEVCTPETRPTAGFMAQLLERLSGQIKFLAAHSASNVTPAISGQPATPSGLSVGPTSNMTTSPNPSSSESAALPSAILDQLDYTLQMICLQRHGLTNVGQVANIKQLQHEQGQLLVRLGYVVVQPALAFSTASFGSTNDQQRAKQICEFTLDTIASIIDDVNDDVRIPSARALKEKLKDTRLSHLFGSVNSMGSAQVSDVGQGLVMSKEGKGIVGDWKPRVWEILDNGSAKENETSLGLGLFDARRE